MGWLDRQLDKILDAWEMKDIEYMEIYGDDEHGFILEYGRRAREFESSGELILFYNERLKHLMDREPVSVIGDIDESDKSSLRKSEGEAAVRGDKWAVDVYDAVANYTDKAARKALNDVTFVAEINLSGSGEDIEEKLVEELQQIKYTYPRDRTEQYLTNALSGTITQAVVESETENKEKTDLEYIIRQIEELEE